MKKRVLKVLSCMLTMSLFLSSVVLADDMPITSDEAESDALESETMAPPIFHLPGGNHKNRDKDVSSKHDRLPSISKNEISLSENKQHKKLPHVDKKDKRRPDKPSISKNEIPIFAGKPPVRPSITIPNKDKKEKPSISDKNVGKRADKQEMKTDHDKKPSVSGNTYKKDIKKDKQEVVKTKDIPKKENPANKQAEELKTEEEKIEIPAKTMAPPIYAEKVKLNKKVTVLVSTTGDGKGSVSNVDSSSKKVVIPKYVKINSEKVLITSIEKKAFQGEEITSVKIPSSVKSIASEAFAGCEKLTKVTIPKSVKTIGTKAFYGCKNLKNITIKSTSIKKIGSDAFSGISSKATIKVPKKKLAYYKKLLKGKIPDSVSIK